MLLNDYINELDYNEELLINEACEELETVFSELPIFCESAEDYYVFSENVASGFISFVSKCIEAVRKFFADVFGSIASAFEKKDVSANLAKFKKLSAAEQKECIKALKEKKLTQLDVDKFEKAVKAIKDDLEKAYAKYETMNFKDSAARDAYVNGAMESAMKKLKALDEYMEAKMEIPVDHNALLRDAEAGAKATSKRFEDMISDITDSMEKIGKKESADANKDVDKTSGRKSFVVAFKNLGRTVRTGFAKHGKDVLAVAGIIGAAYLGFKQGHITGFTKGAVAGNKIGSHQGYVKGFLSGEETGKEKGFAQGKAVGDAEGHKRGTAEGRAEGVIEGEKRGIAKALNGGKDTYTKGEKEGAHSRLYFSNLLNK